jgi:hypothetical protein
LSLKQLGQANDLGPLRGRLADALDGVLQILVRVGGHRHLHQSDAEFLRRQSENSFCEKIEDQFLILSSQ